MEHWDKQKFAESIRWYRIKSIVGFALGGAGMFASAGLQLPFADSLDRLAGDKQLMRGLLFAILISPPMIIAIIWGWIRDRRSHFIRCPACSANFANSGRMESVLQNNCCYRCNKVLFFAGESNPKDRH